MPPTPFEMFTNLSYELLVTEVLPGQSATEAIQYNSPVYSRTNLSQPYEMYPSTFTKLDTGKLYAWQVVASNGLNYAAKTEVWTFSLKTDSVLAIISLAPYIRLNKKNTEMSIAQQGMLKMEIINSLADTTGIFTVRDLSGDNEKANPVEFTVSLPVKPGENYIQYDMNVHKRLKKDHVYEVEYKNSLGETRFMRFYPAYYR